MTKRRIIIAVLFIAYISFIIWVTLLSREPIWYPPVKLEVFWSYRAWIAGESYGKAESIQNIFNILFFVPFGLLYPLKKDSIFLVVLIAALFSITIEILQFVFCLGWCELDDVICNTVGALVGFYIQRRLSKLHIGER